MAGPFLPIPFMSALNQTDSKTRLPYKEAKALAEEVLAILAPACETICIAGSIRREAVACGDIEICCVPKRTSGGLFGEEDEIAVRNQVFELLRELLAKDHRFELRPNKNDVPSFGPLMAWLRYKGFALDVFSFRPEQWAVGLLIRTGPASFSRQFAMRRSEGGFLMAGQALKGWRIETLGKAEETPTEESVFACVGLDFVEPQFRV